MGFGGRGKCADKNCLDRLLAESDCEAEFVVRDDGGPFSGGVVSTLPNRVLDLVGAGVHVLICSDSKMCNVVD